MDLGATVCKRTQPDCDHCPFTNTCEARAQSRQTDFPYSKPKKAKPVKTTGMLIIVDEKNGHVLLEQRPPSGIWGGLWSFPECRTDDDINNWCKKNLGLQVTQTENLAEFRHTFSHYHLDIQPVRVTTISIVAKGTIMDSDRYFWYNTRQPDARGLPAPIKTLLANLGQSD
jgi:A/G-specific adenine glycosylase